MDKNPLLRVSGIPTGEGKGREGKVSGIPHRREKGNTFFKIEISESGILQKREKVKRITAEARFL